MKHLTENEIIDFVMMNGLDEKTLKNASIVTGHITECKECLRRVRAYQTLYDEFVKLSKQEYFETSRLETEAEFKTADTMKISESKSRLGN